MSHAVWRSVPPLLGALLLAACVRSPQASPATPPAAAAPGTFTIFTGGSSAAVQEARFRVTGATTPAPPTQWTRVP